MKRFGRDVSKGYSYFYYQPDSSKTKFFISRLIIPDIGITDSMRTDIHISIPNEGQPFNEEQCHVSLYMNYPDRFTDWGVDNLMTSKSDPHLTVIDNRVKPLRFSYYPYSQTQYGTPIPTLQYNTTEIINVKYNTQIETPEKMFHGKQIRDILREFWNVFVEINPDYKTYCSSQDRRKLIPSTIGVYREPTIPKRKYERANLTQEEFYKNTSYAPIFPPSPPRASSPIRNQSPPKASSSRTSTKPQSKKRSTPRKKTDQLEDIFAEYQKENERILQEQRQRQVLLRQRLRTEFLSARTPSQYQIANEVYKEFERDFSPILMAWQYADYLGQLEIYKMYIQMYSTLFTKSIIQDDNILYPIYEYLNKKWNELLIQYVEFADYYGPLVGYKYPYSGKDLTAKWIEIFEKANAVYYDILYIYAFMTEWNREHPDGNNRFLLKIMRRMFPILAFHSGFQETYEILTDPKRYTRFWDILTIFNKPNIIWNMTLIQYYFENYMSAMIENQSYFKNLSETQYQEAIQTMYTYIEKVALISNSLTIETLAQYRESVQEFLRDITSSHHYVKMRGVMYQEYVKRYMRFKVEEQTEDSQYDRFLEMFMYPFLFYLFVILEIMSTNQGQLLYENSVDVFIEVYYRLYCYYFLLATHIDTEEEDLEMWGFSKYMLNQFDLGLFIELGWNYQKINGLVDPEYNRCQDCCQGVVNLLNPDLTIDNPCVKKSISKKIL